MSQPPITTSRLTLRPFTMMDIEPFSIICTNPEVMRYIGPGKPLPLKTVKEQITTWIELYQQQGYGLLAIDLKQDKQLIGFCGLLHQLVDNNAHIELGYRLDQAYWGKGLATEAALAIKEDALGRLKITQLISIIHQKNQASKKVALNIGMQCLYKTKFKGILVDIFGLDVNNNS